MTSSPQRLNPTGCVTKVSPGKGRGVYASKPIPTNTIVEISPVLLFSKSEYEEHGKHTILDHYTFKWPDGRMALALGLGSLFNHSDSPNISFILETSTNSIHFVTTRGIGTDEELCIFYGHNLWFSPVAMIVKEYDAGISRDDQNDEWGGLLAVDYNESALPVVNPFADGETEEILPEEELPFIRCRLPPGEEEPDAVRTIQVWVVDVPDQRLITTLLKWLKIAKLDTSELAHLKRIRKQNDITTFLLSPRLAESLNHPPQLPKEFNLPSPYIHTVPASSALTPMQLALKTELWPTMYSPRRKDEQEEWSRGKTVWAWAAMQRTVLAAVDAGRSGENPIAAFVPAPYGEASVEGIRKEIFSQASREFMANDTRKSANHPLRHAVINLIRTIADSPSPTPLTTASVSQDSSKHDMTPPPKGPNYLLTSLTLFTTHEPCVMCSMALLHSRVKEVFYLHPMSQTGACGSIACLPTLKGVNHRYSIAQWKQDRYKDQIIKSTTGILSSTRHGGGLDGDQSCGILDIGTIDA